MAARDFEVPAPIRNDESVPDFGQDDEDNRRSLGSAGYNFQSRGSIDFDNNNAGAVEMQQYNPRDKQPFN
jgi:hypothetical protein